MAHPPVRRTHNHLFNFQQHITPQSLFIRATFTVKGIPFSDTAMLDSGCSTWIIPISRLLKDAKKHITHSNTLIKGINGNITTLGELNCDITIDDRNCPPFKEVNILVTSAITPNLIGQNILSHRTLTSYSINNENASIEFKRSLTSGHTTHTTPLTSPQDYTTTSKHNPVYEVQTNFSTEYRHTTIAPQPDIRGKTTLVKTKYRVNTFESP